MILAIIKSYFKPKPTLCPKNKNAKKNNIPPHTPRSADFLFSFVNLPHGSDLATTFRPCVVTSLLKGPQGPDVGSSDPGPWGPKLRKQIFNLFWAPGAPPNRCALKFDATYTYFHNFWWHGMKILIF